jgi:hypothetical protein
MQKMREWPIDYDISYVASAKDRCFLSAVWRRKDPLNYSQIIVSASQGILLDTAWRAARGKSTSNTKKLSRRVQANSRV